MSLFLSTDAVAVPTLLDSRKRHTPHMAKKSAKRIARFGLGAVFAGSMGKGTHLSDDLIVESVGPWREGLGENTLIVGALRSTEAMTAELVGRLAATKMVDGIMLFACPYRAGTNPTEDAASIKRIVRAHPEQQFGLYVFTENGSPISHEVWEGLGSCKNIAFSKFTDSNPRRFSQFCSATPGHCQVINGCTPRSRTRHRLHEIHKKERCRFIDGGSSPILSTVSEFSANLESGSLTYARTLQTWMTRWCGLGAEHGYSQFAWNAAAWRILLDCGTSFVHQHIPVTKVDLSKVETALREFEELS